MIFGIYRLYLCIGPAHYFYRFNVFANVTTGNFYTMTAEVQNAAATGLFHIPKPIAVRSRVRFS
jgi:hypothetical protein